MIFFLGSSFQTYYICKPIFENPYHLKGGWMGDHAHVCFIVKIIVNLNMKWVVGIWCIHLTFYCCFNWYHWILSIGINIDIFLYTHICLFYVCMFALHIVSISVGIIFLHTYIDDLFVPIIFLYLRAQILFLQSLIFKWPSCFNWLSFQLVS